MNDASNISPLDQARILSEALPHMQEYDDETIVIKYGGHAMGVEDTAKAFARDIVLLEQTAINPVVALELLATGTWAGTGVLGPEAFDAVPFLDLLTAYGSPWGLREGG